MPLTTSLRQFDGWRVVKRSLGVALHTVLRGANRKHNHVPIAKSLYKGMKPAHISTRKPRTTHHLR